MNAEQFSQFCKSNGGQKAVAQRLQKSVTYINWLCKGRSPVTKSIMQLVELIYGKQDFTIAVY